MKKYIISIMALFALVSCELDENIDPNNPKNEAVNARMKLATAQVGTYSALAGNANKLGSVWMNSYAGNIYYFGNPMTKENSLQIDKSFYSSIFNNIYLNVSNLQDVIDDKSDLPNHKAIGKILKAHSMQYVVDLYNDVPYSEAFDGIDNIAPKYDKAVDIYIALVKELNDAVALIDKDLPSPDDNYKVDGTEDVVLAGDMEGWKKLANTVKLRYLVRLSKTTDAKAIAFRDAQLATMSGVAFLDADVTIQPGYDASTELNMNPLYSAFGLRDNTHGLNTYGWRLIKASKHIAGMLNGDTGALTAGTPDPRRFSIFRSRKVEIGGAEVKKVVGLEQGADKDPAIKGEWGSSNIGGWFMEDEKTGGSMDGYIMTLAEAELLQAEALVHWPGIIPGSAEDHFKAGITASCTLYEVEDADRDAYMTAIDPMDGAGWTGSADKLSAIQYQRWIALTNINGMETYLGYLKTGFPVTPLSKKAERTNKPLRLVYPASEYSRNATNVPPMTADDAFSQNEFTPFWQK